MYASFPLFPIFLLPINFGIDTRDMCVSLKCPEHCLTFFIQVTVCHASHKQANNLYTLHILLTLRIVSAFFKFTSVFVSLFFFLCVGGGGGFTTSYPNDTRTLFYAIVNIMYLPF